MDLFGDALMRYLASIVNHRQDAEDLFQGTWVRVAERIDRFDPGRPFGPWLFRLARNAAYDHLRRRRWLRPFESRRRSETGQPPAEEQRPDPRDFGQEVMSRDIVAKLLAGLDPGQREIVHLRFWAELSYEEIAELCAVPIGTVKSRLSRALARLGELNAQLESGR
jgi:RNA polymerase sigma-70 factor (ECF subfamily)